MTREPFDCLKCDGSRLKCAPVAAHQGRNRNERVSGLIFQGEQCGHKMIARYQGGLQAFRDRERRDGQGAGIH